MRRVSINPLLLITIVVSIVTTIILVIANMNTSSDDTITSLENKIDFIDKVVWASVAISVILGGSLFIYKSKLNNEQKKEIKAQQERIAQIELNIAIASKAAEEAKLETEKEKIKRLELQKAIAPREIDINKLAEELKDFSGYEIKINHLADIETAMLMKQFVEATKKAGIKTTVEFIMTSTGSGGAEWLGIKLFGHINNLPPGSDSLFRFAKTIERHFIGCNIQIQLFYLDEHKFPAGMFPNEIILSPKTLLMHFGLRPLISSK